MNKVNRRDFLKRLAKVGIFLPVLESVPSLYAQGNKVNINGKPINLVCISVNLGHYLPTFNPKTVGLDYEASPCLSSLKEYKLPHTVVSGAWHNIHRAHGSAACVWTGIDPAPGNKWRGHSISLDQLVANLRLGQTFLPYLNLKAHSTSYNKKGIKLQGYPNPQKALESIFQPMDKSQAKVEHSSIQKTLNFVHSRINVFRKNLTAEDNLRIDNYTESLNVVSRDADNRLEWVNNYKLPKKPELPSEDFFSKKYNSTYLGFQATCLETIRLMLMTNLTKVATTSIKGGNTIIDLPGIKAGWHDNTHHGGRTDRREELYKIDVAVANLIADFAKSLQDTSTADGKTLLDNTLILYSSGLGDANTHSCQHLPFLAIGGGLKHKGHVSFLGEKFQNKKPLLCSIYIEVLQHLGFEIEEFGNANKKSNVWS